MAYAIGTGGRVVCLYCGLLTAQDDLRVDFGADSRGRRYWTGLCRACQPPAPDPMTHEDAMVEEIRRG